MPVTSLVTGSTAVAALGLVLLSGSLGGRSGDRGGDTATTDRRGAVTLDPAPQRDLLAQFAGGFGLSEASPDAAEARGEGAPPDAKPAGAARTARHEAGGGGGADEPMVGMGMGGEMEMGMGHNAAGGRARGSDRRQPKPRSATAQRVLAAMDQPVDVSLGEISVSELESLSEPLGVPVLVDPRGIEAAEASGETVKADVRELPLRTALRKLLRPLALQAVVEDEGLVITADTTELARRGIGTSQWVSIDNEAAERIDAALDETGSVSFHETPLQDVANQLSEQSGVPVVIDRRALEEVGLTRDAPVTVDLSGVRWGVILEQLLAELDLTYANRAELLAITTPEAAESQLLTRIYWLDATGLASDTDSLMQALQTSIDPSTWEQLGGPSTMVPITTQNRRALVVTSVTPIHEEIDSFLSLLRENFYGDPSEISAGPEGAPRRGGGPGAMRRGMGGGGMF